MIGYVCYVDRFAGTLAGVRARLDYLAELGVTYLHLMPLLKPRDGDSDGGYAVADYDAVDPHIGSMTELTRLAGDLHRRGLALCVDMVLNHTAREHAWARKAAAGDPFYRGFYLVYPDRSEPDAFERTLPDIFPEIAPGNFTYDAELSGWVWTTFNPFQWDLNYANPDVFRFMLRTMLNLANRGVDVLRLDAAPFLWKRLGTNCMNQPETHLLLQAFRALTRLAAPGLLLKAEAMVGPDQLGKYLGDHDVSRPECDLAYDNQLMVMLWSAVATGDTRLAAQALNRRRPAPRSTSWATFVRSHDDIGWAVSHTDTAAVGFDGHLYRKLLSDFYAGKVAGSFARGEVFQDRPDGESPISGTLASLCGVEAALTDGDAAGLDLALRRLESMYSVVFSFGGIPLLYMGDELALRNDPRYRDDPAHRHDNRWLHRPAMDWAAAARRSDRTTVEGRSFAAIRGLIEARRSLLALRSGGETAVVPVGPSSVLSYRRVHPRSAPFLSLTNFGDSTQYVDTEVVGRAGLRDARHVHSTAGRLTLESGRIVLEPCSFVWLTGS